ncbi:WD40 repeat-like protein [Didymella exigua CBS 183.55]|uniref:WD40 repeat-like protein n=1 Tax=Didymella exigua CBS 183.55 TaxID=1150837 RepID=A0A6A5RAI8_9PLEO|nr:WD40 repeat-like protein [Didymella exigua CBS 183.55]KAF1922827.1 WD40 repeat-like protein [Didymella exigua CBS 183.55]
MTELFPKFKVTDPHSRAGSPQHRRDTYKTSSNGEGSNGKLVAQARSPTSPTTRLNDTSNGDGSGERRSSEAAIDPLSQQILKRTNTAPAVQKLRAQNTDPYAAHSQTSLHEATPDKKHSDEAPRDLSASAKADRKKGVSFLSRFIGNKKKSILDGASDNGSEFGDFRPEGMDAQLYVDNFGFSPKHPQPPAYIKVRTKFKSKKEFDRVFLAQELRSGADKHNGPVAGSNPAPQSGSAATKNPIWATEFSKDGRYLAAGGQDQVIRVWAVLSSAEERRAHKREESDPAGEAKHLSAPVFQQKPYREYNGHSATILDLSWSKNNFLLSSSMDKTVRLWHIIREENLCTFKHSDFVPSIQFHPMDDRFFLAGSLDSKLRLWSIPDKSVAYTASVPDMITAVSFSPDGKTCIAGTLGGLCNFYDTEGLKWQAQLHVKSTRGQNAKGSKITGLQATYWPPGSDSGEIKLLVSSNDSRLRVYNMKDKSLDMKFKGHENNCSQIRAAFVDGSGHIVCGSEDRKAYIWSTSDLEGDKKNHRPVEMFEAHNSITTCTVFAPLQTRVLLSASEDPIYDMCNPPPVTLVSNTESVNGSRAPAEIGSAFPTPTPNQNFFPRANESPTYTARCEHRGGNIIITTDYKGSLKVFRQDCAYEQRVRSRDTWEASSKIGRPSSILSRTSRSRRDSVSTQPPNDRIMTWRQGISHGSFDSLGSIRRKSGRSVSPRKSMAALSLSSSRAPESPALKPTKSEETTESGPTGTPETSLSVECISAQGVPYSEISTPPQINVPKPFGPSEISAEPRPEKRPSITNSSAAFNGQNWFFWASEGDHTQSQRPTLNARASLVSQLSQISRLTSEMSEGRSENGEEAAASEQRRCKRCGGEEFEVANKAVGQFGGRNKVGEKVTFCKKCRAAAD